MNILIYQWKAYNGRDVEAAFRSLGCRVTVFSESHANALTDTGFRGKFLAALWKERFDFVFSIDYFDRIADACDRMDTPYVSWSCDAALTGMYRASIFNPRNYIFLFDRADYLEFKAKGVKHIYHLPLGASEERIPGVLAEKAGDAASAPEISFVGTLYAKNQYDALENTFDPYLKGYMDACIEAQLHVSGGNLLEYLLTPEVLERILKTYRLEAPVDSEADLAMFFVRNVLGYKTAREERLRVLETLGAKYPVTLFGSEAPPDAVLKKAPGLRLEPVVDYWRELPVLYNQSKINLNLTIPNIASGVPLRVYDILMSGGFLITNDRAELHTLFTPGEDFVIFDGFSELLDKTEYYLTHEEERKDIAKHGRETVLKRHTVRQRVNEILTIMKKEKGEKN